MLTGSGRHGSARALSRCHLMTLTKSDLLQLMLDDIHVRHAIFDAVRNRIGRGTYFGRDISEAEMDQLLRSIETMRESFV